jgi:hypothetical protein
MIFENRVLRRIFGSKKEEATGGRRKSLEELRSLYSSPNIDRMIKPRRMKWSGHLALMGEKRNTCSVLVSKLEGKRRLSKPRHTWEHNVKIYSK